MHHMLPSSTAPTHLGIQTAAHRFPYLCCPAAPPPPARATAHAATINSCVGRLGYDLEGKCKEIVARQTARGGGGAKAGRSSPNAKESAARRGAGGGSGSAAPNYTSESVIEDIYGGITAQQAGTGTRDRATRASRRAASSVSWGISGERSRGGGRERRGLGSLRAPPQKIKLGSQEGTTEPRRECSCSQKSTRKTFTLLRASVYLCSHPSAYYCLLCDLGCSVVVGVA